MVVFSQSLTLQSPYIILTLSQFCVGDLLLSDILHGAHMQ